MPEETLPATVEDTRFEQLLAELLQAEERGERADLTRLTRSCPELEQPLREFFRRRAGFARLAAHLAPTAEGPAAPPAELPPGSLVGAYEVLHKLGHGGRGEVYWVSDPELNRPLAVKVLRPELRGQANAVQRFLEEAQVTGQLQHPGIVPVHAAGTLPDGRPYFAMKLVQGRTLAAHLAERPAPAHELPHFLGVFGQVCQAVAYAHSRGVVHRDLKPSNVMVGAFGEVQVMDWGLAKVLSAEGARGDPKGATPDGGEAVRTVRTEGSGLSSADGMVVGTVAYMAPEQARGEVEQLDPRADVFGLGAILCEVLTGQPPYAGASPWRLYRMAAAGELAEAFARLDGCGADGELIALAKECLAPERTHRPGDAGVVAVRLAAYLAEVQERLREAELRRAAAEARRAEAEIRAAAERRARRLTAGLAAAVLAALLLAGGGGLWFQHVRAERRTEAARQAEALRQEISTALAQAVRFRKQGHFEDSRALLDQALRRLGTSGPDELHGQIKQTLADTRLAEALDAARQRSLMIAPGRKLDLAGTEREYAAALSKAGLGKVGDAVEVVAARVRASAVRAEVVAALDDWAGITGNEKRRAWLLAVGRAADPDPARDRLRQPALWRDGAALAALAKKVRVAQLSPQLTAALAQALLQQRSDAVPLLREALLDHPDDFWLLFNMGSALGRAERWDEAVGYYRAALALRPRAIFARNDLGNALRKSGNLEEAVRQFQQGLRLDPDDPTVHYNLALTLSARGRLEQAVGHYRKALKVDPTYASASINLGAILRERGKLDEAITHYAAALKSEPDNVAALTNLGTALFDKGRVDEAKRHIERAAQSDNPGAKALYNHGLLLHCQDRPREAVARFRQAIAADPKYATVHGALGRCLLDSGRFAEARDATRRCLELLPEGDPQRARALAQWERCQRIATLAPRLPALLRGLDTPAGVNEALEFGWMCQAAGHHAAAVRLYADAFAADPRRADELDAGFRYHAACCAAVAAGALKPGDPEAARLRRQALDWLRADLALRAKQAAGASADGRARIQRVLWAWQNSPRLAGLRDRDRLSGLPDAERKDWESLWAEVERLRARARVTP